MMCGFIQNDPGSSIVHEIKSTGIIKYRLVFCFLMLTRLVRNIPIVCISICIVKICVSYVLTLNDNEGD